MNTLTRKQARMLGKAGAAAPKPAALLSDALQSRAQRYIAARRRSGDALLEAVAELRAARLEADYGAWGAFLEAIGLDDSQARAQIRIANAADSDPAYAERIRIGFLTEATAREVLSLPDEARGVLLAQPEPPTRAEIRAAKREPAPAPTPAESALIAAQAATPGSAARHAALEQADVLIDVIDDTHARVALRGRYQALALEHWTVQARPAPVACVQCGAVFTNGHFGGRCGPCYRGETPPAAEPPPPPPAAVLESAGWRFVREDAYRSAWIAPGLDADGLASEVEFYPDELEAAAAILRAEPHITVEALVMRLTDPPPLAEGEGTPAQLAAFRELATPPPPFSASEQRSIAASQQLIAANRENPAWRAGGTTEEADGPMADRVPVDSLAAAIRTALDEAELQQIAALILDGADWPGVTEAARGRFLAGLFGWMRAWAVGEFVAEREAAV